jgi:signal transduction histidine kinase
MDPATSPNDRSLHILLIEDEPAHAELISLAFKDHDRRHRLTVASSIAAGTNTLQAESVDAVLVDLLLPDGRGTDLISENAAEADYPILLLTSHGDQEIAVGAMKAGAHDYLVKSETVFVELPGIAERAVRAWQENRRRREAEQALLHVSRLATIGELIAGISHEINQPLYALKNLSQASRNILEKEQPDLEFLRQCIDDISGAATRAGEIVHQLKRFIRNQEPERSETDIGALVIETADLLKFELIQSGVRIRIDSPDQTTILRVDRIQIQQVLLNLLKNAIEAIDESNATVREITIRIELTATDVVISVADTGPGLTSDAENIFEAFVTTKPNGLGIGLAISHTITEVHGGQLTHEKSANGGAVFALRLPVSANGNESVEN